MIVQRSAVDIVVFADEIVAAFYLPIVSDSCVGGSCIYCRKSGVNYRDGNAGPGVSRHMKRP